ncbi:hypothetical protein CRM22_006501 [Opisthorchis felineus]|uniref:Protein Wnt n=1 Tax=Opisthorchis felineus TaxID=147828 RepID=A0A4S2LKM6_OPIFE|nr:hypothetical protein CRM22_006501 [Opisthorchis felineus]
MVFKCIFFLQWTVLTCLVIYPSNGLNGNLGLIYRIKQVRDILVANQPADSNESNVGDDLLVVEENVRSAEQKPGLNFRTPPVWNRNFSHPTHRSFQPPYWRNSVSQMGHSNIPYTASMQRARSLESFNPSTNTYRTLNRPPPETSRWNKTSETAFGRQAHPQKQRTDSGDPENTTVAPYESEQSTNSGAEDFVGPDGRLRMTICDHPNGFLRRQKKLCRRYLHLMESVVHGYFMGLRECEYQFASHRWNCQGHNLTLRIPPKDKRRLRFRQSPAERNPSKTNTVKIKTYLDKLLSKGTRESAYVLAVTSAGVSHAVTKACSSGAHDNCGCDRTIYDHPKEPNFEWSGCSDNIHFGAAFSRQFLDVRERGRLKRKPKLGMTNLHNNHVGRQTVINKMLVQCKCHGVSGSCEMRTCWRTLPNFRELGNHLQERFHKAILVDYVNQQLVPVPNPTDHSQALLPQQVSVRFKRSPRSPSGVYTSEKLPTLTENDLLYINPSPNFCHHDPGFGSIGTYGRRCEEGGTGLNSCEYLCCGRGFKRETFVQEERCNCKFQWCCNVTCQTCRKTVVVSKCN